MNKLVLVILAILASRTIMVAQIISKDSSAAPGISLKPSTENKWYDQFSIRGYTQVRYNRLLETNSRLKCEQCDRSLGENNNFFIRRLRIIFSGQISSRIYFYIQPDFATSISTTSLHLGQIRDAYFDLGLDKKNEYRIRVGQSKVPFGFENLQSSQNRLPLDRDDALNSSVPNERDLGLFFYWAPETKRKLFSALVRDGFKGSGDYGMFAFGMYNGQTANKPELNNNLHIVGRFSFPIVIKDQIIEPGFQGYTGKYVIPADQISKGTKLKSDRNYTDQRVAASFILYPRPFGVQAEYNIGKGPQFNTTSDSIETKRLKGGYITISYLAKSKHQMVFPFLRYHSYDGGKKAELDARSYSIKELELGVEWQPVKQFELTAMYTISNRRFEDYILQNNIQKGNLLRLQAQVNF